VCAEGSSPTVKQPGSEVTFDVHTMPRRENPDSLPLGPL